MSFSKTAPGMITSALAASEGSIALLAYCSKQRVLLTIVLSKTVEVETRWRGHYGGCWPLHWRWCFQYEGNLYFNKMILDDVVSRGCRRMTLGLSMKDTYKNVRACQLFLSHSPISSDISKSLCFHLWWKRWRWKKYKCTLHGSGFLSGMSRKCILFLVYLRDGLLLRYDKLINLYMVFS